MSWLPMIRSSIVRALSFSAVLTAASCLPQGSRDRPKREEVSAPAIPPSGEGDVAAVELRGESLRQMEDLPDDVMILPRKPNPRVGVTVLKKGAGKEVPEAKQTPLY